MRRPAGRRLRADAEADVEADAEADAGAQQAADAQADASTLDAEPDASTLDAEPDAAAGSATNAAPKAGIPKKRRRPVFLCKLAAIGHLPYWKHPVACLLLLFRVACFGGHML